MAVFATMAMLLACLGVHALISYSVGRRLREIGIRVALGAQARTVTGMFVSDGLMLAGIGIAIGLTAALGITRLMSSLLFEVSPIDPTTYGVVSLVLIAAAALASYVPALRAAGIDPLEALRAE
jgi:ABC-type antimicrobial peptide transport system permease subunit